jgi:hypothetical protein
VFSDLPLDIVPPAGPNKDVRRRIEKEERLGLPEGALRGAHLLAPKRLRQLLHGDATASQNATVATIAKNSNFTPLGSAAKWQTSVTSQQNASVPASSYSAQQHSLGSGGQAWQTTVSAMQSPTVDSQSMQSQPHHWHTISARQQPPFEQPQQTLQQSTSSVFPTHYQSSTLHPYVQQQPMSSIHGPAASSPSHNASPAHLQQPAAVTHSMSYGTHPHYSEDRSVQPVFPNQQYQQQFVPWQLSHNQPWLQPQPANTLNYHLAQPRQGY